MGPVAVGGVKAAELDGVTIDAYGTLLTLADPMPELLALLPSNEPSAIEDGHASHYTWDDGWPTTESPSSAIIESSDRQWGTVCS